MAHLNPKKLYKIILDKKEDSPFYVYAYSIGQAMANVSAKYTFRHISIGEDKRTQVEQVTDNRSRW